VPVAGSGPGGRPISFEACLCQYGWARRSKKEDLTISHSRSSRTALKASCETSNLVLNILECVFVDPFPSRLAFLIVLPTWTSYEIQYDWPNMLALLLPLTTSPCIFWSASNGVFGWTFGIAILPPCAFGMFEQSCGGQAQGYRL
jgi:hypothetical protein